MRTVLPWRWCRSRCEMKKRIISIDCVKKLKHLSADLIHFELEGGEKAGARKVCDLEALNCRCRCDARRGEKMLLMWHSRLSYAMWRESFVAKSDKTLLKSETLSNTFSITIRGSIDSLCKAVFNVAAALASSWNLNSKIPFPLFFPI